MATPILHHQVTASLGEFGDWDDVSGADLTVATTDYYEAGVRFPRKIPGTHSYSDITLMRGYDPIRDRAIIEWVERYKLGVEVPRTMTWIVRNQQGIVSDQLTYLVRPMNYKKPDGKSGDNTVGQIALTLAVEAQS